MRARRLVAAALAAVLGSSLAVGPASAAAAAFTDPEGDANGFFYTDHPAPLPSEPALDVTLVTLESDGTKIRYTAHIKQLADTAPPPSTGYYFRLGFTYAEWRWRLEVLDDATGDGTFFIAADDPAAPELPCDGCFGLLDRKRSVVVVTAPIRSLTAGMRQWQTNVAPLGPGARLIRLEVVSQRSIGNLTASADIALGGESVFLTL